MTDSDLLSRRGSCICEICGSSWGKRQVLAANVPVVLCVPCAREHSLAITPIYEWELYRTQHAALQRSIEQGSAGTVAHDISEVVDAENRLQAWSLRWFEIAKREWKEKAKETTND